MNTTNEITVESYLLKRAVDELYFWQHSYTGCFANKIYDLFSKADPENYQRLSKGFPFEAIAFSKWKQHSSSEGFFKEYSLIKGD